jgi:7,8-dihydroneopterin aldolase/epimerase/oxygenase
MDSSVVEMPARPVLRAERREAAAAPAPGLAWPPPVAAPVADIPAPGSDRIFLRGLRLEALIGVYPHERLRPQPLLVDLELTVAHSRACFSDELADAVDYGQVVQLLRRLAAENRYLLLEAFAQQVAETLLATAAVCAVTLTVSKPGIFAEADAVGVSIHRQRRRQALAEGTQ